MPADLSVPGHILFMKYEASDLAIMAHIGWITHFHNVIAGIERDLLDPAVVLQDSACEFGRWLQANASRFASAARYEEVRQVHRHFHEDAAEIVKLLSSRHSRNEIKLLVKLLDESSTRLIGLLEAEREQPGVR